LRSLYEIADAKNVTVGDLTGTRRRYTRVNLPEQLARLVGLGPEDVIELEHFDDGMAVTELPYWSAFYDIKAKEQKQKK
jgi:hypothetical protein